MKLNRILTTRSDFAPVFLRLALGVIMAAHGAQKLFGWFGGYGLQATGNFFAENLGLKPGLLMAALAGGAEFFGGVLLVIGLFTRPAAALIGFTMVVALVKVHNSSFFLPSGMEFVLALLAMSLALIFTGGGRASVDAILAKGR